MAEMKVAVWAGKRAGTTVAEWAERTAHSLGEQTVASKVVHWADRTERARVVP